MRRVLLLRNFAEDKRVSMEIYAEHLYRALLRLDTGMNIRYYRPASRFSKTGQAGKWAMRFARYLEYPSQVRRFTADLYHINEHGYAHLLKNLPSERTIVTVHDLIPFLKYSGAIRGLGTGKNPRLSRYSLSFLKQAAGIISVSENTKRDLIEHCGCRSDRISVIHHGLPEIKPGSDDSRQNDRKTLNLPEENEKLLLITGQDYYKNLDSSIQVYNQLRKKHAVSLIHLGRDSQHWQKAKSLADDPGSIIEFDHLPMPAMITLYRAADCLLFPSWYEGFGLPPLEAMACGTPVVCSNAASLPEVVGDAALTADPDDVDRLCQHVEKLLYQRDLRQVYIDKGLSRAKQFSWTKCAEQTAAVYRKTLAAID